MPGLAIGTLETKNALKSKLKDGETIMPIAIIKGDDKKYHNKLLFLDTRERPSGTTTKITIPDDCAFRFLPTTHEDKRFVGYMAGASGAGKSYLAKQIADNYKRMFPDRPVYLVSKLTEDDTIDSMEMGKPIRLDYMKWLDEGVPDINSLSNSLIIFDDYDTIEGEAGKIIQGFINDIAIMGRKHTDNQGNVSMLCLSHYLTNFKLTRIILSESQFYVVYPTATSAHALRYLLKNYVGLDDDVIKKLRKMGRWVVCYKQYPQFIMSSHECMLLHHDE